MKAILTSRFNGAKVEVHSTTEHPESHYGHPVWVDKDNQAYVQVGMERPYYTVEIVEE